MLRNLQQKLLQKEKLKQPQKQLVIKLVITLLTKSQVSQELQRQLKENIMKKTWNLIKIKKIRYLKKDISVSTKKQKIIDDLRLI